MRFYKRDALYFLMFIILLSYILSKIGFYDNIRRSIYISEQKALSKKIMSYSEEYKIKETLYADIYYTLDDTDFIGTVERMTDVYSPLLKNDFGIDKELDKLKIVVYPEKKDLESAIGLNYNGKAPMGVYYGGVINLLSPTLYIEYEKYPEFIDYFLEKGPIIHELAHYMLDLKTDGNFEIWFSEGLALYYEKKYTGFEWRKDLENESKEIAYFELKSNFYRLDESLAYRRSFDIINNFVEVNGEEQLQQIISYGRK